MSPQRFRFFGFAEYSSISAAQDAVFFKAAGFGNLSARLEQLEVRLILSCVVGVVFFGDVGDRSSVFPRLNISNCGANFSSIYTQDTASFETLGLNNLL